MSKESFKQNIYYVLIAVISILALAFLPMLGTEVGLEWSYPTTVAGIVVYWVSKACVAALNVLIYYSFRQQAIVNIKDDPHYKEARTIEQKLKKKDVMPRSPRKYLGTTWGVKGTTIALGTAMGTIALTQAILSYDWITMLTYLFTIIMGIIFGILQMKNDELYWTDEYYEYATRQEAAEGGLINHESN